MSTIFQQDIDFADPPQYCHGLLIGFTASTLVLTHIPQPRYNSFTHSSLSNPLKM